MITGIGIDIVEIERIDEVLGKHKDNFIRKLLTAREIDLLKEKLSASSIAGRFAAKEAISKALGVGFGASFGFHDVEIIQEDSGKPVAIFSEKVEKEFKNPNVLISISHSKSHATAIALLQS